MLKESSKYSVASSRYSVDVERRRLSLAKHLDRQRFDQKFICTNASGNIPDEIRAEGFEVIPIGQLKSPFDGKQHRKHKNAAAQSS